MLLEMQIIFQFYLLISVQADKRFNKCVTSRSYRGCKLAQKETNTIFNRAVHSQRCIRQKWNWKFSSVLPEKKETPGFIRVSAFKIPSWTNKFTEFALLNSGCTQNDLSNIRFHLHIQFNLLLAYIYLVLAKIPLPVATNFELEFLILKSWQLWSSPEKAATVSPALEYARQMTGSVFWFGGHSPVFSSNVFGVLGRLMMSINWFITRGT